MTGPPLVLEDAAAVADLRSFLTRAHRLGEDGAVRLQAADGVCAFTVEVLPGSGLLGSGEVLGMRVARQADDARFDVVVAVGRLLASAVDAGSRTVLDVPASVGSVTWTAVTPPRRGWEPVGTVPAAPLAEVARAGVAEVAVGAGTGSGGAAVAHLRARVWGRLTETVPPVPAGLAFGAYALGFLPRDGVVDVVAHGRWTRVSSPAGHVLGR